MTNTQKEILQHVFDVLDLEPEVQTYLVEKEKIKSVSVLTANTDANFIGIRTRSDGVLSHTEVNLLQLFRKWYHQEYRNKEITTPLPEYFTEDVWENFLADHTEKSVNTPRVLPNPPTFSSEGALRSFVISIVPSPLISPRSSWLLFSSSVASL